MNYLRGIRLSLINEEAAPWFNNLFTEMANNEPSLPYQFVVTYNLLISCFELEYHYLMKEPLFHCIQAQYYLMNIIANNRP